MNPKRPANVYLILILGALTALSPFSIDMYLPAFQKIAADFHVQVTDVSLSLSAYFVGLAIGQLFYGPLLDRFGRKRPLYIGLSIFILASIGCMFSKNIETLIMFRVIQALGGCAAQVASMAMVRDFFDGNESAKIFSLLILILGASPLLAPTIGAYLSDFFGWQAVFIALSLIGVFLLSITYFFLPEGHQPDPTHSLHLGSIFKNYWSILVNPHFATYTFAGALAFSGLFVYLASSPIIFLEIFQINPHMYGWIFGLLAAGFIACSQLNIFFMKKWSSEHILSVGMSTLACVGFVFFAGSWANLYGMVGTILFLFLYLACAGVINPNASALALVPFTKHVGSAAALMGSVSMVVGSLSSMGVSLIHTKEVFPFTFIFMITSFLALLILKFGKLKISKIGSTSEG